MHTFLRLLVCFLFAASGLANALENHVIMVRGVQISPSDGASFYNFQTWDYAVNIASRVMDIAAEGDVLVTRTLKDLTGGSEMQFESAGTHTLKGLSDPYDLYRPLTL